MPGQTQPRSIRLDGLVAQQASEDGGEHGRRHSYRGRQTEPFRLEPGAVLGLGVMLAERLDDSAADAVAARRRKAKLLVRCDTMVRPARCQASAASVRSGSTSGEARQEDPAGVAFDQIPERCRRARALEGLQGCQALWPAPSARRRPWIENEAAADCPLRRLIAQDQPIAVQSADRTIGHDLRQRRLTGGKRLGVEQRDAGRHMGGAEMEMHGRPVAERTRFRRQQAKPPIEAAGRRVRRRID